MAQQQQPSRALAKFPLANWPWRLRGAFPAFFDELEEEFNLGFPFMQQQGITFSEDAQNYYVECAVPGLQAGDIDITLDKGVLMINGEKKEVKEDPERRYYSRATTAYSYRLALPSQIDESQEPKAMCKDGILTLSIQKAAKNQMKKIPVKASS